MKKTISLLFVALLLISVALLAGCGINGTYQLTKASGLNSSINTTDYGISATLTIDGNTGTYYASYEGQSGTQVWVIDTKNKLITDGENNVWNYVSRGKILTLSRYVDGENISMEFVKVS